MFDVFSITVLDVRAALLVNMELLKPSSRREYENCLLDHPSALGNLLWVAHCVLKQWSKAEFQVHRHHTEQVL